MSTIIVTTQQPNIVYEDTQPDVTMVAGPAAASFTYEDTQPDVTLTSGAGVAGPPGPAGPDGNIQVLATYTALRALTGGTYAHALVRGASSGLGPTAGTFAYDAADSTTADNGGTVIVDADGRRWKRLFSGALDIRWFGADNTVPTTDVSAAVSAALAVVGATAHGGEVYIPGGHWTMSNIALPLTFLDNDLDDFAVVIRGAGNQATIIHPVAGAGGAHPIFEGRLGAGNHGLAGYHFRDFRLDGRPYGSTTLTATAGLDLAHFVYASIERVFITQINGHGVRIKGFPGAGCNYVGLRSVSIYNCATYGLWLDSTGPDGTAVVASIATDNTIIMTFSHNFQVGDSVAFSGTDSTPVLTGPYTVTAIPNDPLTGLPDPKAITISGVTITGAGTTGTATRTGPTAANYYASGHSWPAFLGNVTLEMVNIGKCLVAEVYNDGARYVTFSGLSLEGKTGTTRTSDVGLKLRNSAVMEGHSLLTEGHVTWDIDAYDPADPTNGGTLVLRGGSYSSLDQKLRLNPAAGNVTEWGWRDSYDLGIVAQGHIKGWHLEGRAASAAASLTTPYGGLGRYQNYLRNSEDLSSIWTLANVAPGSNPTITADDTIAPNGLTTADKVAFGTERSLLQQAVSPALAAWTSKPMVLSFWAKTDTTSNGKLLRCGLFTTGASTVPTQDVRLTTEWRRYVLYLTTPSDGGTTVNVRFERASQADKTATITAISTAELLATSAAHGYAVGDTLHFSGTDSTPVLDTLSLPVATTPSTTTYTVSGVDVTVAGTTGTSTRVFPFAANVWLWGVQLEDADANGLQAAGLYYPTGTTNLATATSGLILRDSNGLHTYTPLVGSKTFDPPNITASASTSTTVTVTGARAGMQCYPTFDQLTANVTLTAVINASDTVTVWFRNNNSGSATDLPSGTLRVVVLNL